MLKKSFILLSLLSASSAFAINHSTVCNVGHLPLAVVWTAAGCAGIRYGHLEACHGTTLQPGQCERFKYHWGDSNDNIHMGSYYAKAHTTAVDGGEIDPIYGRVKGGNCKNHSHDGSTYKVSFDKWKPNSKFGGGESAYCTFH